jgi:hypothetical protein
MTKRIKQKNIGNIRIMNEVLLLLNIARGRINA